MEKYIRGNREISKEEFEATKACLSVADVERERKALAIPQRAKQANGAKNRARR